MLKLSIFYTIKRQLFRYVVIKSTYIQVQTSPVICLWFLEMKTSKIGDKDRAIFLHFICFTKKMENILSQKYMNLYVKSVKESKYLVRISISLVVLELWPKISQNKSCQHFPHPWKKQQTNKQTWKWGKNESHPDNPWNHLYILANFDMSGIFRSPDILVQTQLSHLYHSTLKRHSVFQNQDVDVHVRSFKSKTWNNSIFLCCIYIIESNNLSLVVLRK